MRPAPNGDTLDILSWIEASRAKHARELGADLTLEDFKRGVVKFHMPHAMLLALRQTRLASGAHHEHDHRFLRPAGVFIFPNAYGKVDGSVGVIASGGGDLKHAQLLE